MKANELMIGDWVQGFLPDTYSQVYGVINECRVAIVGGGAYMEVSNEDIQPIPLTAEILEKNGFYKQKWSDLVTEYSYATDLDKSPQTVIQYTIYSKEIEGVKSLCKIWTKSQYGNGQNDCHICGLYYVHELQHALRLCGITHEIVL